LAAVRRSAPWKGALQASGRPFPWLNAVQAFGLASLIQCGWVAPSGVSAEMVLRVTRPEAAEVLTVAKGKTFVIGVVEPPTASLECNGARCDVSADGAFIGYAPFEALGAPVRQGTNWCDVAFDFVARADGESVTNRVWAISPRSPSAALVPELAFDPPRPLRVLGDAWLGVRKGGIGRMLFASEGAVLSAISTGKDGWRVRLRGEEEAVVPSEAGELCGERERASPAWILESDESFGVNAWRAQRAGGGITNTRPCYWGFNLAVDGDQATVIPRPPPRAWAREEAAERPLRGLRVCLDPGHHPDRGAVGPRGLEERDSNLRLARALAARLRADGAKVSFTREDDPLPLRERHRRIRDLDPDVVLSLHNNSVGDNQDPREKHGTQTFWCHPWSKDLAEKMHAAIVGAMGTTDMGCIRRDLYLPRYPGCPTVLLEPEYLILPEMEKKFRDDAWVANLAEAIARGLREFAAARQGAREAVAPAR
jgi:N-acetylmuramoyl-L-alanine amidase